MKVGRGRIMNTNGIRKLNVEIQSLNGRQINKPDTTQIEKHLRTNTPLTNTHTKT